MSATRTRQLHGQIARNIKAFRTEREITLTGLAKLTGIGKSTLSNLERGQGNPTIETIWRLARVLGVGYGDLVGTAPPQSSTAEGVSVELIDYEQSEPKIETFRMTFESGSRREAEAHAPGVTEHIVVTRGALTVGRLGHRAVLDAGQAGTFQGDAEHVYQAAEAGARAIISVVYPELRSPFKDQSLGSNFSHAV